MPLNDPFKFGSVTLSDLQKTTPALLEFALLCKLPMRFGHASCCSCIWSFLSLLKNKLLAEYSNTHFKQLTAVFYVAKRWSFFVTNGKGRFYENNDKSKTTAELRKFKEEKLIKRVRTRVFYPERVFFLSGKQGDLWKQKNNFWG